MRRPSDMSECHAVPPSATRSARNLWNARQRGQLTKGAAGRRAARRRTSRRSTSSNDLSSSGCLEEAGQQPDRRDRRDALREQVARYTLGHLPTREAAPSTQCEAGVRDWAKASSGSRQPEFTRRPPHPRCGMSSSPTLGIGSEAARSESQQGGPEGLRAFLHDAFRGGAEVRLVRRSERPPPPPVPRLGPRLYIYRGFVFHRYKVVLALAQLGGPPSGRVGPWRSGDCKSSFPDTFEPERIRTAQCEGVQLWQ